MIRSIIFTFFLSLLGLSSQRLAFSQSISSFTISPFTTQSFYIWCTDQNGTFVPYCTPTATVGYYPFTGGHNHDDANHGVAANEQISNITSNGQKNTNTVNALIYFNASRIGEQEYVTVCANTCTTATANVQYSGFQQLGSYSQFVKIGATGIHPSNHWGTTSTLSSVVSITGRYAADYSGVSRYQPVGVNDIALQGGGIFDICATPTSQPGKCVTAGYVPWQPPHNTHDFGTAVDFRANCGANSVLPAAYNDFVGYCQYYGLGRLAYLEDKGKPNQHIHCDGNTIILQ